MNLKRYVAAIARVITLSGCAGLQDLTQSIETKYQDYQFNQRVNQSQMLVLEARAFLVEGYFTTAKAKLDEAYYLFPSRHRFTSRINDITKELVTISWLSWLPLGIKR